MAAVERSLITTNHGGMRDLFLCKVRANMSTDRLSR